MTTAKIILLAVLAASLLAQTTPSNIGPTPPPHVKRRPLGDVLSECAKCDGSAPGRYRSFTRAAGKTPKQGRRWNVVVTTPPYELGTHYYGFLID
jgi:hypothetical protein